MLTQQAANVAQLQAAIDAQCPSAGEADAEALVGGLFSSASKGVAGRREALDAAHAAAEAELASLEERLRAQEALTNAELASITEVAATQRAALAQLEAHEQALLSSAPNSVRSALVATAA